MEKESNAEFVLDETVMDAFLKITSYDSSKDGKRLNRILLNIFPKYNVINNSSVYLVNDKVLTMLSNYAKKSGQVKVARILWKSPTVKGDSKEQVYC